jgi:glycosyltransferase involved in cell wall biosynthesis
MYWPKISIITPSFNQGLFIEETIQSVLNQNYPNLEYIIIDGGSTDNTVDIIKKYEQYLHYWVSEPDRGQAHAINKGFAQATGEIFNWINSDDYLAPGALQDIGNYFTTAPQKNILCGYTRCFYDEDNSTSHEYRMGVQDDVANTILNVAMNQPGSFYRTKIVKQLGGVNESLRYVFDDDLWFRYLCWYGIDAVGFTDKRLAEFRLHENSKSVGEGFDLFNKEIQSLYIDIAQRAGAADWLLEKMAAKPISNTYHSADNWSIKHLDTEKFKAYFAAKYLHSLYISGHKKASKQALRLCIDNGYFKWNRLMISLRLKLLFA